MTYFQLDIDRLFVDYRAITGTEIRLALLNYVLVEVDAKLCSKKKKITHVK